MVAAESFCGMEQMTPVLGQGGDWNPIREVSRLYGESHDDDGDKMDSRAAVSRMPGHTFDGNMSSMCNGCRRLSVGVLMPRVLCPMVTTM
jgi:hypothetical protein